MILGGFDREVADRREPADPAPTSLDDRILTILADADQPIPFADLRARCRVRTATLYERLSALATAGRIVKDGDSYRPVGD